MNPKKQIPRQDSKSLIFVSYFYGIDGMVMSEWVEDKLLVAESQFPKTYLITSFAGKDRTRANVRVFKVPSLSWKDYSWELSEYARNNESKSKVLRIWYPIAATFGRVWDVAFAKISTNSAARWSWGFTALPVALCIRIINGGSILFATGGATGGHLVGLLTNLITKVPLFLEFQDPLLGSEMVRSNLNSKLISKLEGFFISKSTRTVFVTKRAASASIERHPKFSAKIAHIYPGAWRFPAIQQMQKISENHFIEILHLGTLYGARNLDNLFIALDRLKNSSYKNADRVRVKNLGDIYLENKSDYLMRPDFEILPSRTRTLALQRALDSDALLLVQHADARSSETIPYKTFDYLNLGKPIIGVINNPELEDLLDNDKHFLADATSVESIQSTLEEFFTNFDLIQNYSNHPKSDFNIERQFERIFGYYG